MGDRKHDIERYLRGELSSEEMYALEKEALNDPFLAEALEGIEQAGPDNFLYDLHTIRRSVHDRVRSNSKKKNKAIRIWAWTGAIAATLLLIAVSGFIVLSLIREQAARQLALEAEAERMPPEFLEKDTLVIALPAQQSFKREIDRPRSLTPAGTGRETLVESPSVVAEADDQSTKQIPSEEQSSIAERTDDHASHNQAAQVAQDIARHQTADGAELKDRAAAQESISPVEAETKRGVAGVQRNIKPVPSTENAIALRGRVVDADGEALPGVNVTVKDSNIGTVTNAEGQYELRVPPGYRNLLFTFIGFQSTEVVIDGRQEVNITLNEDVASLSEVVVVTGYGSSYGNTTENSTFQSAEPDGGRNDFKKYLESAVKYPPKALTNKVEGRVTVQFTVEPNGQLTNFDVIKGIGSGAEEALIDAIKAGPAWKPAMQGGQRIADKVKVRYRFKLPG